MKKVSITGYFTEPDFDIRLSHKLLELICNTIEYEILAKYNFPKVKATELEIFIDSEIKTNERKVVQLSETGNTIYFTFRFFIPYHLVVQNNKVNISLFVSEFMECITIVFSPFKNIPDELIDNIEEQILAKTNNKKEYEYIMSNEHKSFRKILDKVSKQFEAGELV